jgi:hypothetical protein
MPEPMGRYLDANIYDWIDFKVDGEIRRATFVGAVDMNRGFNMPTGGILLQPGLIYQFSDQDIEALNTCSQVA